MVALFSLRKSRTGFSEGHHVRFSARIQVKTKTKEVIMSADVKFSAQIQVKTKKRSSRPQAIVRGETSRNFCVAMV